jgi:DNA-binding MarR family transcriptional regulator
MDERREVTAAVRRLLILMRRLAEGGMWAHGSITPMQGRVIGFLTHHHSKDVFQRDLEREFQVRRSTASAILQTMERDGLLKREPVAWDARLKRLVLTHRAEALHGQFRGMMAQAEAAITRGVTPEELDVFFRVVDKFEHNLNERLAEQADAQPGGCGEESE